jgi:hypothetical protein
VNCEKCSRAFSSPRKKQRFCSRSCAQRGNSKGNNTVEQELDFFWERVDKTGECWLWTGYTKNGYGRANFRNKKQLTHRISWQVHKGEIPKGLFVCHSCDVRSCVNPAHLFLGTHQDNMEDCKSKGRFSSGESHKLAIVRGLLENLGG